LGFRRFLFERHGGKSFVELEPLIILFHVGLDFCFVSRRTCVAFCWSGALGVYVELPFYFFERRHGDNGVELARFLIILFEVVRSCATFSLGFTRFCVGVAGEKFSWARAVN
jgi:hypothetical protein